MIETIAESNTSFADAMQQGIAGATKTLRNVTGAWMKEQDVTITDGQIVGYQVNLKIPFVLEEPSRPPRDTQQEGFTRPACIA